uniref:E3 ubiquitin-protein ligase n=1 Tax=Mesocestoides corti TaxID=53468 RepID=A0A5K3F7D1_MESCO
MEADPSTLLEWLRCGDHELQFTSLEYLCNIILFSEGGKFLEQFGISKFVVEMLRIFSDDMAPDNLLEVAVRTLTYTLEAFGPPAIQAFKPQHYRVISMRLDTVDMTSTLSSEFGQQIVKLLDLAAASRPQVVYRGGVLTSVLRFIQFYSECVHTDVLRAGMDLIRTLCRYCEPSEPDVNAWMESLTALLDHRDHQIVVNNALQALASIVNQFARAGQDPTPLATPNLIARLSSHLYKASSNSYGGDIHESPSYYRQSALELSSSHLSAADSLFNLESRGGAAAGAGGSNSDLALVNSLTNLLLTLCCSSTSATRCLLQPENRLASALATILLNWGDENTLASVYRLLEVIILILGPETTCRCCEKKSRTRRLRTSSCRTSTEHEGSSEAEASFERQSNFRAAVEAIRNHDIDALTTLLSDGPGLDLSHVDNRGQTLLNWAASFGTPEMLELLCSQPGVDLEAGARTCLDYAAGFGRLDICQVLLRHGANPNAVNAEGKRPIDRARLLSTPDANAIVDLLEDHMSGVGDESATSPQSNPKPVSLQSTAEGVSPGKAATLRCRSVSHRETQALPSDNLFVFASELLPVLITAFENSQSESVKYQTVLILVQLVGNLTSCSLQTISEFRRDGISLSFRLSEMIYTALAEESENTMLCAVELCQQLLAKLRATYLPLFYRTGVVALVKSIHSLLQHHTDPTTSGGEENEQMFSYVEDEAGDDAGEDEHDDSRSSGSSYQEDEAEEQYEGEADEGVDGNRAETGDQEGNCPESEQAEGKEDTEDANQSEDKPSTEDKDETGSTKDPDKDDDNEVVPLPSARLEIWQDWGILTFGNLLFIYTEYASVQLDINCANNALRGFIVVGGKNDATPLEIQPNSELVERPGMRNEVLRLISQIYKCFGLTNSNGLLRTWPYMYLSDHPKFAKPRCRSACRRRSPAHVRPRHSSQPASRTYRLIGDDLHGDVVLEPTPAFHQPRAMRAGNLLLDFVQSKSDMYFLRVRPSGSSDEALLFSACSCEGFILATAYPSVTEAVNARLGCGKSTRPRLTRQTSRRFSRQSLKSLVDNADNDDDNESSVVIMDGRIWDIQCRSGWLNKKLFKEDIDALSSKNECRRLLRFHIHHLAQRLLTRDFVASPSQSLDSLRSAPPLTPLAVPASPQTVSLLSADTTSLLGGLMQLAADITALTELKSAKVDDVVRSLTSSFQALSMMLGSGEESVTPYELSASGLISALLLCLSPCKAADWRGVIDSDDVLTHLIFLRRRRQAFLHVFKSTMTLPVLTRCLVRALDQSEHLPLHLFEFIPYRSTSRRLHQSGVDAMASEKAPASIAPPLSCPPNTGSAAPVFTFSCEQPTTECPVALPLGILASPHLLPLDQHTKLTAGGIRGLVDFRVNRLLGAWLPSLAFSMCVGCGGMHQLRQSCPIVVKRQRGVENELQVDDECLYLQTTLPNGLALVMTTWCGRYRDRIKLSVVKDWSHLCRTSMAFFEEFAAHPNHSVCLLAGSFEIPPEIPGRSYLALSLFDWLGTNGGTMLSKWVNPASIHLVSMASFKANSASVYPAPMGFIGQTYPPRRRKNRKRFNFKEEECDSHLLNGEQVGARFTVDLGLQLVPTAYRLASLRREGKGPVVRNWCLQASNDRKRWTTLSLHRNDNRLNESVVTIPLNPRDFRLWSVPLAGNMHTSVSTRPLPKSSGGDANDPLDLSTASTQTPLDSHREEGEEQHKSESSWRLFRIMDLTPLEKQGNCRLLVRGFDLFGVVVTVHDKLLPAQSLSCLPSHSPRSKHAIRSPDPAAAAAAGTSGDGRNDNPPSTSGAHSQPAVDPNVVPSPTASANNEVQTQGTELSTAGDDRNSVSVDPLPAYVSSSNTGDCTATVDIPEVTASNSCSLQHSTMPPKDANEHSPTRSCANESAACEALPEVAGEVDAEAPGDAAVLEFAGALEALVESNAAEVVVESTVEGRAHTESVRSNRTDTFSLGDLFEVQFADVHSSDEFHSLKDFQTAEGDAPPVNEDDDEDDDESVFKPALEDAGASSSSTETQSSTATASPSALEAYLRQDAGDEDTRTAEALITDRMKELLNSWGSRLEDPGYANHETFRLTPGLIPVFDPNGRNANASSEYDLLIKPNSTSLPPHCRRDKRDFDIHLELFARLQDGTPVASVVIDDDNAPIYKYLLELAEKAVYADTYDPNEASDPPHVKVTIEYSFRKESPSQPNQLQTGDSLALLTPRDIRLIRSTEDQLRDILGIQTQKQSTVERTEELLQLLQTIAQLTDISNPFPNVPLQTSEAPEPSSPSSSGVLFTAGDYDEPTEIQPPVSMLSPDDFVSRSLTRKVLRQVMDALSVAAGPTLPDWCLNLPKRVTPLFPFEVRHRLFRACAFGPARSIMWLQNHARPVENQNDTSEDHRMTTTVSSHLQRTEASRLAAVFSTYFKGDGGGGGGSRLHRLSTSSGRQRITSTSSTSTNIGLSRLSTTADANITLDRIYLSRYYCGCLPIEIGRLHREFVRIPRGDSVDPEEYGFWAWAERVMDEHAERKSELEIQFIGEEGTGIGPTLEFFSLLALELRLKSAQMWLSDEELRPTEPQEDRFVDEVDENQPSTSMHVPPPKRPRLTPPSPYVNASQGLFPTPYPRNMVPLAVLRRFYIMGIAVAKCLQDNRLIDLPLSKPFTKLISRYGSIRRIGNTEGSQLEVEFARLAHTEASQERIDLSADPLLFAEHTKGSRHWLTGLLDFNDFALLQPERARLFRQFSDLLKRFQRIRETCPPDDQFLKQRMDNAAIEVLGCTVDDLCIDMEFVPQHSSPGTTVKLLDVYSWESPDSVVDDDDHVQESVSNDNLVVYIRRTLEYCLDKGIRAQMDAFRAGFERVFNMDWLALFSSHEVGRLISGDSGVTWSREDLLAYTVPCLGYTKTSTTFLLLVDVLNVFDADERRDFLRFTTGCSSLPPGGLRSLNPRLRVVRKDASEGPYPSVNTCVHYLKLPEYGGAEELRHYLLAAMREMGFYLN